MGVSRQAVSDAMAIARKQLEEYEAKLGLVRRYLAITQEAEACLTALDEGRHRRGEGAALPTYCRSRGERAWHSRA